MLPWNDRAGILSALKLIVFLGVLAPGAWIALPGGDGHARLQAHHRGHPPVR